MPHAVSTALQALRSAQLDVATPNYCFRSFVKADAFPLFKATRNEHFNKYLLWSPPTSVDATVVQIQKLLREESLNRSATFSIVERESGTWAGLLRWIPYDKGLAISFWLHPDFWGTGASKELVACMFDIAFKGSHLNDLYAMMQPENRQSIRLVKSRGMQYVGDTKLVHEEGHPITCQVYHVDQQTWKNPLPLTSF